MPRRTHKARLAVLILLVMGAVVAPAPAVAAPRPITAAFYYAWYPET